jgi:hypothetical protein
MIEQIFLLSPAHCGGRRAATLLRPAADFDLAKQVRSTEGAELGDVFSYVSRLYFRGKVAYARAFGRPPEGMDPDLVITSGRGLLPGSTRVRPPDIEEFSRVPIDPAEPRYRGPLVADVEDLRSRLPEECRIVLLGSIATSKYVELLLAVLGGRLCFPAPFPGMGDMARGAMMLRAAREGTELPYVLAEGAVRSRPRSRQA